MVLLGRPHQDEHKQDARKHAPPGVPAQDELIQAKDAESDGDADPRGDGDVIIFVKIKIEKDEDGQQCGGDRRSEDEPAFRGQFIKVPNSQYREKHNRTEQEKVLHVGELARPFRITQLLRPRPVPPIGGVGRREPFGVQIGLLHAVFVPHP